MERFVLGKRHYFSSLSGSDQKIYREIYNCWVNGGSVARLTLPGSGFVLPSGRKLHQLVTCIIEENPHLFHLETSQFHYSRCGSQVTIQAEKVYTQQEYERVYARLLAIVKQIVGKAARCSSDYQKFLFLHNLLAQNITYTKGKPGLRAQREVHTIAGALLNKACVCDGYARAYRLLCDQLQLSCAIAVGRSTALHHAGPHAWNFVKLNNKVYHVDVTWDSCLMESGCPVSDYYFLRNDAAFSRDHAWDRRIYPRVVEDYPRKEKGIRTKQELEGHLCELARSGKSETLVWFPGSFPGAEQLQRQLGEIISKNPTVFRQVRRYGSTCYEDIKYAKIFFE